MISPNKSGKLHKLLLDFALMTRWTPDPTLETARLILRSPTSADLPALAKIYANPAVAQYRSNSTPLDAKQSEIALDIILAHWKDHGFGRWMLLDKNSHLAKSSPLDKNSPLPSSDPSHAEPELIGHAGLEVSPNLQTVELNYLLDQPHWGQGLATEASREILRYGFEILKLPRIAALINPDNQASIRVAQKLGMGYSNDVLLYEQVWRYYSLRPSTRPGAQA